MISKDACKKCCRDQIMRLAVLLGTDAEPVLRAFDKEFEKGEIKTAPEYAEFIFNAFNEKTGISDPYKNIKKESNIEAIRLLPMVNAAVGKNFSGIQKLMEMAIVGNMIDYGAFHEVNIEEFITSAILAPHFKFELDKFEKDLEKAKTILYIADNAGEIFFDIGLLKHMNSLGKKIYFAVRGAPIINDVTEEDAEFAGIHEFAQIISTGAKIPGILMSKCSNEFKKVFYDVDLVISKGQGNFETIFINVNPKPKTLYYLFVVKCKTIGDLIGGNVNDKVLMNA